jgi:chromate transporter
VPDPSAEEHRAPAEPLGRLFLRFLGFGALAWGGPVAQIAMLRRSLVDGEGWVSSARFNRTLAVYQVLPGPEAHELCIYFGMLARGRIGGFVAGFAFMAPGALLMLLLSWLYVAVGLGSPLVAPAFAGCQAAVLALIVRGLYRIATRSLGGRALVPVAGASVVASLAGLPFLLPLAAGGAAAALWRRGWMAIAAAVLAILVTTAAIAAIRGGADVGSSPADQPAGTSEPSAAELLISGLRAGSLTFGGAYTAIPFIQEDAVGEDGWMSNEQFLDGLALSGVIPAPLIIFASFVGYLGGALAGAVAITIGIFLPAFAITLLGHGVLERAVANPRLHDVLDGVTAAVVGLMVVTTVQLGMAAMRDVTSLMIFGAALGVLFAWSRGIAAPIVIAGAAVIGVFLYGP